ncbi:MAG: hypothetical protein AABX59_03595 [Nanoarchaeota archaeon]
MRIGEIKNIVGAVLAENNTLEVRHESIYGGQAYQINNFAELIEALGILSEQSWNDVDYTQVREIRARHEPTRNPTILTNEEFNQLNSYVNNINSKVPLYYSILESLTEDQDEKTINIRLPEKMTSLSDLNRTNDRLHDTLKYFNVDGQFEFKGFDRGTEWYVLIAVGVLSHRFFITCLKIAQEYFKTRTEYFKSEEAKRAYEASLRDKEQSSEKDFDKYKEKWLSLFIREEVGKAIEQIGTAGQTKPELHIKLVKATEKLVAELGEGTEFHLSLNPPTYAKEVGGELRIDYKKLRELKPKEETKQLEDGEKKSSKK